MNNFVIRTLSAAVYAGLVVSSILVHPCYFGIVFAALSILSVREYMHLTVSDSCYAVGHAAVAQRIMAMVLSGVMFACSFYSRETAVTGALRVIYGCLLSLALVAELFYKAQDPIRNWGNILISQVMIALPFALMAQVYGYNGHIGVNSASQGPLLLLSLFILIWVNDSGAYIVGSLTAKRARGNHKMFVRVSPNKSWEGLAGGFVFALSGGWVLYEAGWLPTLPFALVFALLISAVGTLGDLMESLFKRTLNIKDSGKLMPGHGGALDRFDSLLLATPIIWLLLLCWQV
ncbi:MAG: phosphatidate cytidylyltransferase [Paludibacteraceae bacterium]|nr:phosphatidate cytidylyltransferase [Paludibacteraceae bacterium]